MLPLPMASLGLTRHACKGDLLAKKQFLLACSGLITKLMCVTGDTSQRREMQESEQKRLLQPETLLLSLSRKRHWVQSPCFGESRRGEFINIWNQGGLPLKRRTGSSFGGKAIASSCHP